ncbi:MAG: SRPBCC family protein [Firmicutes bacterium]|nr:SRPBCC family protein [Bacillota bacterium]
MKTEQTSTIVVEVIVNAPAELVWKYWSEPEHITQWNSASDDWFTPHAENDLRPGGKFLSRMEAKDGSFGFDFSGAYDEVKANAHIAYTLDDKRKVSIDFIAQENKTKIIERFEAENENSIELQKNGWQSILDRFKNYVEGKTAL